MARLETPPDADLLLVGGGLANGLIAWRLAQLRPALRVRVLEAGCTLGGNHTWSFHDADLTRAQQRWMAPLVGWRWPGHEVRFPGLRRRLGGGYASIASEHFHRVLTQALGDSVRPRAQVVELTPTSVRLASGELLRARGVIDARGLPPTHHLRLGFQKFLGQVLTLARPHGLPVPRLMDATVDQHDGFRFIYCLPLDPCTVLVEDTCYADGETLDAAQLRRRVADYAAAQGWQVDTVRREEQGVLPIALDGDMQALWREAAGVPRAGLAAALFHPTTGYSLPEAVRLAEVVAALPDLAAPALFEALRAHALQRWRSQGFYRLLGRMLFQAARPQDRWRVMQRFYGLPEGLIERFYAGRSTPADRLRVLVGKPPVPLAAAWRAAWGQAGAQDDARREVPT
ncbi:lycopene beta-cyclase CrtY [Ramlibacter rhizophilus]|uniref:Lycopene cyclase n=1 Tax=Ramlibacter rhizophilus TaxID=1781167 RepID=A0A4Z0BGK5_9BURK|nr:lycopene beta-cyclase CrtY [Ramlibacter rhizophilus]TFY98445.1 lycopene cyclase [Ramlibacter rhizophilus]